MLLSQTSKESIKTALAMVIAYGIALSLNWQRPYWAGFAVAFISLDTLGQSLNKGLMRLLGTLLAIIFSLALIGIFPQDRWLFMVTLVGYMGLCTYMMGESRYPYFWFIGGFVAVIIASDAGMNSVNAFETAMMRIEETGLGLLVYILVALFLWPHFSARKFDKSCREITATIHSLYRFRAGMDTEDRSVSEEEDLFKKQVILRYRQFSTMLEAARIDNLEVQEFSKHWQRVHALIEEILHILEYRHDSLLQMKTVSREKLLPDFKGVTSELARRFAAIEKMMAGENSRHQAVTLPLELDQQELAKLSHFQRAAAIVSLDRLQRLESLSRDLFTLVAEIKGFAPIHKQKPKAPFIPIPFSLDVDNLAAALRVMAGLFIGYLAWIYLDIPGGQAIVAFSGALGMALATQPYIKILPVYLLIVTCCFAVALIYIFLMPLLSSFLGLGILLFLVTFSVASIFSKPETAPLRSIVLALFVVITGISNHQQYSFLHVANTVLILTLASTALAIAAYIPFQPGAEQGFRRQLKRYFTSCDYLMAEMEWGKAQQPCFFKQLLHNFHVRQLLLLPGKMEIWIPHLQSPVDTDQNDAAGKLTNTLQALSYRIVELEMVRRELQSGNMLQGLKQQIAEWRLEIQKTLQQMGHAPDTVSFSSFSSSQKTIIARLDKNVEKAIDTPENQRPGIQGAELYYRLLGGYRGVAMALGACAKNAAAINWIVFDPDQS